MNDNYWYDTYDSSQVLEGSAELALGYTKAGEFARAEYSFPGEDIGDVAKMVAVKYGLWRAIHGNLSDGPASFEWALRDGIQLRLSRGWPDTTPVAGIHPPRSPS
ncbi:MAG TPA: hypothetical protein VHM25_09435 [Polyangiaceae bacterium]|nr:hypothetical protein [Polyangiaceae bacterium]